MIASFLLRFLILVEAISIFVFVECSSYGAQDSIASTDSRFRVIAELGSQIPGCYQPKFAVTADGAKFAVSNGTGNPLISIWEQENNAVVLEIDMSEYASAYTSPCRFSPDGRKLVVATESGVVLIETDSGRSVRLDPHIRLARSNTARHVSFSSDSRFLALLDREDCLSVFNTDSGELHFRSELEREFDLIAFDDQHQIYCYDGLVRWTIDLDKRETTRHEPLHESAEEVIMLAVSNDQSTLLYTEFVRSNHDASKFADSVSVIDSNGKREAGQFPGRTIDASSCAINENGDLIAVKNAPDESIEIWSTTDGQLRQTIDLRSYRGHSLKFFDDGEKLAFSTGYKIVVWDVLNGKEAEYSRGPDGIRSLIADDESSTILVEDYLSRIWAWDAKTFDERFVLSDDCQGLEVSESPPRIWRKRGLDSLVEFDLTTGQELRSHRWPVDYLVEDSEFNFVGEWTLAGQGNRAYFAIESRQFFYFSKLGWFDTVSGDEGIVDIRSASIDGIQASSDGRWIAATLSTIRRSHVVLLRLEDDGGVQLVKTVQVIEVDEFSEIYSGKKVTWIDDWLICHVADAENAKLSLFSIDISDLRDSARLLGTFEMDSDYLFESYRHSIVSYCEELGTIMFCNQTPMIQMLNPMTNTVTGQFGSSLDEPIVAIDASIPGVVVGATIDGRVLVWQIQ